MAGDETPKDVVRPVRWSALRADEAERIIRERAAVTSKVIFGVHAFERVEERSITQADAMTILRQGRIEGAPALAANGVDWKVVVVRRMPGGREAGAVSVIYRPPSNELFVVTVEWMDTRR
jgi:hypothetical protein